MAISRSKWDSFIKCPLCFYLLEKHKIKPPGTPGHPINSRVDALLKEEFDNLRAKGQPHPIFKEYNLNKFLKSFETNHHPLNHAVAIDQNTHF